jgi:DNA polymerase III delta prime subunit
MKQTASNQQSTEKRSASELLRIFGAVLLVVALLAGGAAYQFGFSAGIPIAICFGVAGLGVMVWSFFVARRAAQLGRMAAFLATELGADWNPEGLKGKKYTDGVPRDIDLRYQERQPDHDPEWRRRLTDVVRQRMGVDEVQATWKPKKNRVRMLGLMTVITELDQARKRATDRIRLVLQPLFRNVELSVTIPGWQEEETLKPTRIELAYGVTSVDGSELWVRRVEAMAGLKIGGRWRAAFDPTHDRGFLEPRPVLPTNLPHPGVKLYDGSDPAHPKPSPKSPCLYYGHDENGKSRGWVLGKKSTMPHMLIIGPTGGGKTTVLRSLILGAVAQGIPVFAADPKMIELTPFYGFPGCYIASTPDEIATMIETMEALMMERYAAIKKNPHIADTLTPVLFILDELLIARQVLKRLHAQRKLRGTPRWFEDIQALAALARSAQINVVIGVQRPDASLFDEGSRDNFRQRLSLMRVSPQGSEMLWGSRYVGVDLPMVQGRAMASPDGDTPIEMQTFWVADPITASGQDRETIEAFRELGQRHFADYVPPVDVSAFENDMPEIDPATLPTQSEGIDLGAAEDLQEAQSGLLNLDTQDVKAEQIAEGDQIVLDDGEPVTVVTVEEDPFDEDSVQLTIDTGSGEELRSMSRDLYVSRVLSLEDA